MQTTKYTRFITLHKSAINNVILGNIELEYKNKQTIL